MAPDTNDTSKTSSANRQARQARQARPGLQSGDSVDPIPALVAGRYPDPDGDGTLDPRIRRIAIRDSLKGHESAMIQEIGFGEKLAIVSDVVTHRVLGQRVERALAGDFAVQSIVLGEHPHADEFVLRDIIERMADDTDGVIAVGSGTINDLCKAASAKVDRPYAVFGTAPSMNGYASTTASIAIGGLKRSIPSCTPRGVFLDVEVLAAAPSRMIRAGLAECLCRSTSQSDWLLAHMLFDQPYRAAPFELTRADEEALIAGAPRLLTGDLAIMTRLARALVLSGIGMTICGSSRPSSQGEHMISHYIDMMRPDAEQAPYHGEQIAVTTLFMAALQQHVLGLERPPRLSPQAVAKDQILAHFGERLGELCWRELSGKRFGRDALEKLNARLEAQWDAIRLRIEGVTRSFGQVRAALAEVGAPLRPDDVGWTDERFRRACRHAREIRDRYTFLDLASDGGVPFDAAHRAIMLDAAAI